MELLMQDNWHNQGVLVKNLLKEWLGQLNELPSGIIAVEDTGEIIFINRVAGSLLQIHPPHAIHKLVQEVSPNSRVMEVFATGKAKHRILYSFGNKKYKASIIPICLKEEVIAALEFIEDHTEMIKLTEEITKLQKRYSYLETIINESFEELGAVDKNGCLVYISKKSASNLGVEPSAALGRNINELTKSCLLPKVARTGIPEVSKIKRPNKEPVPVMVTPLYHNKELEGAVCKSIFSSLHEAHDFMDRIFNIPENNKLLRKKDEPKITNLSFEDIIGNSKEILRLKHEAARAAHGNSNILLLGETGTGKEIFAHAIHSESDRKSGSFVRVNCAGIPENLLEAELFGYEEGAFTGARKGGKPGKFELADKGTLFLDEIGDMRMVMQAKILRVLQDHEVERVGGVKVKRLDIRVIAATNKDLVTMVRKGLFREDLYYRLDVVTLQIPPLRNRAEDIPLLIKEFIPSIRNYTRSNVTRVSEKVVKLFQSYQWPGNIRQLKNILEGAMNLCNGDVIGFDELPERIKRELLDLNKADRQIPAACGAVSNLQEIEKETIIRALNSYQGNKRRTAQYLGIPRSSLYNKIKRYKIEEVEFCR